MANGDAAPVDGIFIPLSSLPAISAADADPANGNGSEVVRGLLETVTSNYANIAAEDRPANFVATKNPPSAVGTINQIRETYSFQATITYNPVGTDFVVAAE